MTESPPTAPDPAVRRAWLALVAALVWTALVRVPIVLNAAHHLDSDLAVDGLTLAEAAGGHLRWHYPGTPYMGILPVFLSLPQARFLGVSAATLVSGGVVAYMLIIVFTFLLTLRAFGPKPAMWSLVPLAFASTGTVWLSGRITGGHLLTAAWHAGALAGMYRLLSRGGMWRALGLGFWCGLGLYLDQMFLFTIAAIVAGGFGTWLASGGTRRGVAAGLLFLLGAVVGDLPREAGRRLEPYDAYNEQFATIFGTADPNGPPRPIDWNAAGAAAGVHARILFLDCLPRLIAGHRLPGLESEPHRNRLEGLNPPPPGKTARFDVLPASLSFLALGLFVGAMGAIVFASAGPFDPARAAVRTAIVFSVGAITAAFIINRHIYDSDNYRYLVYFIVAWPVGFGLLMDRIAARGPKGRVVAASLATLLAVLTTVDTARWYRGFGWLDGMARPVVVKRVDPVLPWLQAHSDVDHIFGSYWDVYRLAFLTGGRVKGVPYPVFPNRFPEWSEDLPGHRPRILVARGSPEGRFYLDAARRDGARELFRSRTATVYDWPADAD